MTRFRALIAVTLCLLGTHGPAAAVVIRHDMPDAAYLVDAGEFPALVDMPGSGHGVLIAPQWVVTAAHTIQGQLKTVELAGVPRAVDRVVIHPGARGLPADLVHRALSTGDGAEAMAFLAETDDIALIRLSHPVQDVRPAPVHDGRPEVGKTARLYGKGATGTGLTGVAPGSPERGSLRRAENRIESAEGRWIVYSFTRGPKAKRLEGMGGNGDSGSPVLVHRNGRWAVAGLASWKGGEVDVRGPSSLYGQTSQNVRLAHYAPWIAEVLAREDGSGNKP
jgi:Trypsin